MTSQDLPVAPTYRNVRLTPLTSLVGRDMDCSIDSADTTLAVCHKATTTTSTVASEHLTHFTATWESMSSGCSSWDSTIHYHVLSIRLKLSTTRISTFQDFKNTMDYFSELTAFMISINILPQDARFDKRPFVILFSDRGAQFPLETDVPKRLFETMHKIHLCSSDASKSLSLQGWMRNVCRAAKLMVVDKTFCAFPRNTITYVSSIVRVIWARATMGHFWNC